jgi:hypothetical protein
VRAVTAILFLTGLPLAGACGAAQHGHRATDGAIAGLARDHDSGDLVSNAQIHIRAQGELAAHNVVTDKQGRFTLPHLAPGRYSLNAEFAGQPIDIENIDVVPGQTAIVDMMFTLGRPDPLHVNFGDPGSGAIEHYRPPHLAATASVIEGTVNDLGTHGRVSGAVVTVVASADPDSALQAVSDDQGRYRFDTVTPGTYAVSAYYAVGGRGQMEVRRSEIHVAGAEAVIVPLWVELAKQ